MIFTNLAPNVSFRDARIVASFFLMPWRWNSWQTGRSTSKVTKWLRDYLHTDAVYLVDSGRSALYLGLQTMDIGHGDEVIVPGYTCIVVTNAIRATGAVPVLVDIDTDLNMNEGRIHEAITSKTKAILAQHTFGLPADMHTIQNICNEHNLLLIEDCAHALGAHYDEKPLGNFGDIAFLSFGSDKIISSVRGGALIVQNDTFVSQANELVSALPLMPARRLWQHVMYLPVFFKLKLVYAIGGKALLYFSRKFGVTAAIIEPLEKTGNTITWAPAAYPNILAAVVYPQLRKLYTTKMKRRIFADYYRTHLPKELLLDTYQENTERTYLHFPIQIDRVEEYTVFMKVHNIQVGVDWNGTPIAPATSQQHDAMYAVIPTAKELSKKVVQLPIHKNMSLKKVQKVVSLTNQFVSSHV